ncbi:uncharacterized protein LOC112046726 [Bicyclus anynana]|uniref:Uncharacterized protein LOC112046726 n=1 Tax=Bicyclus anynana TaxID=110368 RepID=A0ABM3LDS7_BICAN|nr:uncharacterized protein LOC112046726 [Bicyclus anynana]
MKVKVLTILLYLICFLNLTECITSREYGGSVNSKKEQLKVSRSYKTRGEVMDNLFIVFDPSFLSYVWPKIKNGVHLNIGDFCWEDVSVLLRDLAGGRAWAYRAADASGRYQSGLFEGKRFWLGSKQQCLKLDKSHVLTESNDTWGEFYSGDYLNTLLSREKEFGGNIDEWHALVERDELMRRVVQEDNEAPMPLAYTALQIMLNITKFTMPKSYDITLGLCLPRTCSAEEVVSIINFSIMLNDHLKTNKTVSRSVRITSLRYIENFYDIKTDIAAVMLILVTACLVVLAIIATIVDFDWIKFKPYSKTSSFDLQQYSHEDKRYAEEKKINVCKKEQVSSYDLQQYNQDIEKRYADEKIANVHRKEHKLVEGEALSLKSYSELKKAMREKALPPSITLDVVTPEGNTSCYRCGKYKKQCASSSQVESVPCPRLKYNSCASLTTEYKRKNSVYKSLLLSFSLKHSWMRIFNTSMANKDLAMIHVLRIIAVLWIIFVHVAVTVDYISENGADVDDHNNAFYILATGTLAYDTLFFVSGVFSAQHFFYLKSRYSVEELVNMGGFCGQALQLICFITNRAIRLLPPYMYTIFLTAVLSRVSRDTAVLLLPERDYDSCDTHWWRNLLYISNLYPLEEQCMQVSWYLSAETQLHALGALLCMLLATGNRKAAAFIAAALLFGATGFDLTTAYTDFKLRASNAFALYAIVINRPWSRVAPYFVGVLSGWLVYVMDGECAVSKTSAWCFWSATASTWLASLVLPWVQCRWVAGWLHLTWPVALLWPTLLCATRFCSKTRPILSSACVVGVSRLCYTMFLLHGLIARYLLLSADAALCSHFYCILCYFAGCTLVTLAAALCLSLLLEMPSCCLLRRVSDYTYR